MNVEELMQKWVTAFLDNMNESVDEETLKLLMEACGTACARYHGSIKIARTIGEKSSDIEELLFELNQQKDYWCGKWEKRGDVIFSVCQECGCPLVLAGFVELSPAFCECSRGWVKAVFEAALGKPVEVELDQAIGRGDPVCKFVVEIKDE
jgi:predicted hydrocarbon binding protein